MAFNIREEADVARRLISDAGGEVVGRTRVQKIAYMLDAFGLGDNLGFSYKHYGPYSEKLTSALKYADVLGLISEEVKTAAWGGYYSIFKATGFNEPSAKGTRKKIIALGNSADPVELELAATAVFLAKEGFKDPWSETANRKPEKSTTERLQNAKVLLGKFKDLDSKNRLPAVI